MGIVIQLIGFVALFLSVIAFRFRKHRSILLCRTASELVFALQYILLGAWTAAAMDFISVIRNSLYTSFVKRNRSTTPVIIGFGIFVVIVGIVSFDGAISLLPIASKLLTTVSYGLKNEKWLRIITLPSCILWIIYNIFVGSIAGVVADSMTLVSLLISMYQYDLKKQPAEK